ncbi:MAG: hypothetical protein IJC46_01180 [Clostridia bacterium]|nr:hypothetical protein [Clostridia bacterium]
MKIDDITVISDGGYVDCKSNFYSAADNLPEGERAFFSGVNTLVGDIDSGVWAISYLLSMYTVRPKDFIIFEQPKVFVNGDAVSLEKITDYACYMDRSYPLFSGKKTVRALVNRGLKRNRKQHTADEIRELFQMTQERFERPLKGAGHEVFRAMAAIGYAHGKEIFCFPWLSHKRFECYHGNLTDLLKILEQLKLLAIVPKGVQNEISSSRGAIPFNVAITSRDDAVALGQAILAQYQQDGTLLTYELLAVVQSEDENTWRFEYGMNQEAEPNSAEKRYYITVNGEDGSLIAACFED